MKKAGKVDLDWYWERIAANDASALKTAVLADVKVLRKRDSLGNTLLHYAATHGNTDLIKFMVEQGADINARGDLERTPLQLAVADNQDAKAVSSLLKLGADPNIPDKDGKTPLYWAASAEMESMVRALKKNGATVDVYTEVALKGPGKLLKRLKADPGQLATIPDLVELAVQIIRFQDADFLEFLLDHGVKANARCGDVALIGYASYEPAEPRLLEVLLAHGADPNSKYEKGGSIGVTRFVNQRLKKLTKGKFREAPELLAVYEQLLAAGGDPKK
jgi:ankyrin repeat protein